jgi:hypothetical protein
MALDQNQINEGLAVLADAVNRCMTEDACAKKILAVLDQLAADASVKWPFDQFRNAFMGEKGKWGFEQEARRQMLYASLNGIKRALQRS